MNIRKKAFTFADLLLVPKYSEILPNEVCLKSHLTKRVKLNAPLVSAAMDTVTEYRVAIGMARLGGIGIIHKNMDIKTQAQQVNKVKKSESGVIIDPIYILPNRKVSEANGLMAEYKISGVPVVDKDMKLLGIITNRDMRFIMDMSETVENVMTKAPLITARAGTTLEEASKILQKHKIEKLPITDENNILQGLIQLKI